MSAQAARRVQRDDSEQPRLVELCGVLSLAADLATGMPLEHGLQTALVSLAIAEARGLGEAERRAVLYVALLRMLGCTSTPRLAELVGDEVAIGRGLGESGIDHGDARQVFIWMLRHFQADQSPARRAAGLSRAMRMTPAGMREARIGHCEVAQRLAARLGFGDDVTVPIAHTYERWDGTGPRRSAGEAIPLPMRIVDLSLHLALHHRLGGPKAAVDVAAARAGRAFDPALATLVRSRPDVLEVLDEPSPWTMVVQLEPEPIRRAGASDVLAAATVLADFADQKAATLAGHSRRVGDLARCAGEQLGAELGSSPDDLLLAGLTHDLGVVGVASGLWSRAGPLSDLEWDRVRLHTYDTERILSRAGALQPAARLAGLHHERCDGRGYHRGSAAASLPLAARVLAAADVFDALINDRPYRAALAVDEVAGTMVRLADSGVLDARATDAVLAASGVVTVARRRSFWPDELTDREVDVLRQAARGLSIRQIAVALELRPKTVDTYLQRAYAKIGVSTRAAATLYVIERGLASPEPA